MVLTDDNFASIGAAVEDGRGIYDNIQKFIPYLLSCNAGEVLVMFVAALAVWPAPLAAIQILWLYLVTDELPALALGLDSQEADIIRRPPHDLRDRLLHQSLAAGRDHPVSAAAAHRGHAPLRTGSLPGRLETGP